MCSESMLVPIPPLLWNAGAVFKFDPTHPEYGVNKQGECCLVLDACIVPAVQALWTAGIVTLSCCCGHGDPWGVVTIQTQAGVGQRGAMVMRAERFEELERAEADLAQAHARADALAVENAELREALEVQYLSPPTGRYKPAWSCRQCHRQNESPVIVHAPSCPLAADPAQRGADLLAAADVMAEQIEELNGEYLGCALAAQAYRRLRGGRGPEGGDE